MTNHDNWARGDPGHGRALLDRIVGTLAKGWVHRKRWMIAMRCSRLVSRAHLAEAVLLPAPGRSRRRIVAETSDQLCGKPRDHIGRATAELDHHAQRTVDSSDPDGARLPPATRSKINRNTNLMGASPTANSCRFLLPPFSSRQLQTREKKRAQAVGGPPFRPAESTVAVLSGVPRSDPLRIWRGRYSSTECKPSSAFGREAKPRSVCWMAAPRLPSSLVIAGCERGALGDASLRPSGR